MKQRFFGRDSVLNYWFRCLFLCNLVQPNLEKGFTVDIAESGRVSFDSSSLADSVLPFICSALCPKARERWPNARFHRSQAKTGADLPPTRS